MLHIQYPVRANSRTLRERLKANAPTVCVVSFERIGITSRIAVANKTPAITLATVVQPLNIEIPICCWLREII
ncbi:MAG: hypothetical protein PUP93_14750 [Rhizonema sp. NSF051]|nr:hypothetical protein [Rhizonema sp. NSF051]